MLWQNCCRMRPWERCSSARDRLRLLFPSSPLAPLTLKEADGVLYLAVCTDASVVGWHMNERNLNTDESFRKVWEVTGAGELTKGEVLVGGKLFLDLRRRSARSSPSSRAPR